MQYNELPLVSIDFNHNPSSCIFDGTQIRVDGPPVKVMVWYDNAWRGNKSTTEVVRSSMKNVLIVCGEVYPLIKTGGLADFIYSYSRALANTTEPAMQPVVLVPGYRELLNKLEDTRPLCEFPSETYPTHILASHIPVSGVTLWVVHCPTLFDRPGNPYLDANGVEYADSPQRYNHFCKVAVAIAMGELGLPWQPDIVHCNDWHSGLVPAYLSEREGAPPTVFTVHNLGYQGNYPESYFEILGLPWHWHRFEALEYHQQLSFIKGGLVFADIVTTVSPGYAEDIKTGEFGCGLEGLLSHRADRLHGILNGVDYDVWNPASDPHIRFNFDAQSIENKAKNKRSLQLARGLVEGKSWLVIGFIGRLAHQKGIELLLEAIYANLDKKIQWLILGSGAEHYENQLLALGAQYPDRMLVEIGYDEVFAHQIEASADAFLMPSYYEPCGLNQLYSLKYGTVPIVSGTGGLRDSVVTTNTETLADGTATGFVFKVGDSKDLLEKIDDAANHFRNKKIWRQIQYQGMVSDFSWTQSVQAYRELYQRAKLLRESPGE